MQLRAWSLICLFTLSFWLIAPAFGLHAHSHETGNALLHSHESEDHSTPSILLHTDSQHGRLALENAASEYPSPGEEFSAPPTHNLSLEILPVFIAGAVRMLIATPGDYSAVWMTAVLPVVVGQPLQLALSLMKSVIPPGFERTRSVILLIHHYSRPPPFLA
ncbi:MAG: hypothetical protein KDK27_16890 [Leptospiraceae bacterium]|nr:hypothetical protein [Leptospiraceae bacterium]